MEVLKKRYIYMLILSVAVLLGGCDMKKNTAFNRKYQALNTRYNVYYNANEAFKKGYKKIDDSYAPDYSHVIPLFAVSDKSTEGVAKGDMTKAIEKCELAIQERSMQKKPKKDYSKMRDPNYVAFYNQEEFNTYMDEVWMLYGQSQYYSNDYLAASATFTYVIKHFSNDKKLVLQASLWKARALKELDWIYEAEEIMSNIDAEELPYDVVGLYHSTRADLYLVQHEYAEALPHLQKAVEVEKNRNQRNRDYFVLAQIYQMQGDKENAYLYYEKVIKANPSYQMTFNANILQTEVVSNQSEQSLIKRLQKLAKNRNNADYLDQIYYAMGNIYLSKHDTTEAMKYYQISADTSSRNGLEKAQTLITMGDIYYTRKDYVKAQPCFSEASSIIDQKHDDYDRVSKLSVVLDELVVNYNTYHLQDSLLTLASASKNELSAAIGREIQKVVEEEKRERERLAREREEQRQLELEIENMAVMDSRALGNDQASSWYFYNKGTVDKGKLEFRKKFGTRRLEDNWNRRNKSIMVFAEENLADKLDEESLNLLQGNDTIKSDGDDQKIPPSQDPKRPEFYLRQIPFSEDQQKVSHEQLSEGLFNMAVVYDEKLNDYQKALETYEEFIRRYPNDPRAADAYYCCYRIGGKTKDDQLSNRYRDQLIASYPDSKYAKILVNPNFREKLEQMQEVQDSLYEQTYAAYLKGQFETVKTNTAYMETNYPVSSLMPKFLLLNSLSIGKTMDKDTFAASLNHLVERYPNSDVTSMAKDIIALINQGNIPTEGNSTAGLMALREEAQREEAAENGVIANKGFTVSYQTAYLFKLITDTTKVDQNKLLYETAMYNFTKFLVKDFDLNVKSGVLTVSGLDNYDEALWYINGVIADEGIQKQLTGTDYKYLLITPENLELIGRGFTIEQYEKFYKDSIASRQRNNRVAVELVSEQKEIDEITSEAKLDVKEGEDLNGASMTRPSAPKADEPAVAPSQNTDPSGEPAKEEKPVQEETQEKVQEKAEEKAETKPTDAPKKELKKYKGLYTYDADAPHLLVVLINSGKADADEVLSAFNKYNSTNHALLNLSTVETSSNHFTQIFVVGVLPGADTGVSYLKQMVKSATIKKSFGTTPYRNIVISKDNFEVLKNTGNINVYMELYKRLYLNR